MTYEFGPFRVDARERVLRRDNELVPLTPKVFDILLVLVQNSGRVLTKNEMMSRVWPDTAVEESNLGRNVSTLRKALGEVPGEYRYVETIPWRGYRFIAKVRQSGDERTTIDSLAVLPFLNENAGSATDYLADGITESLINKLSRLANLKVMSRNSVFRYKAGDVKASFPDARTVGRELGVRAVLIGRLRQVDDAPLNERTAVDDGHDDGAAVARVLHAHFGSEGKRAVGGDHGAGAIGAPTGRDR